MSNTDWDRLWKSIPNKKPPPNQDWYFRRSK